MGFSGMVRTRFGFTAVMMIASVAVACGPSQNASADEDAREPSVAAAQAGTSGTSGASDASAAPACWIQDGSQALGVRASPLDSTSVALAAGEVKLCYSRPAVKGRKILGDLVPYDVPWRFGANEATALYMPAAGTVAGVAIEPGWVSLYAVPAEGEWEIAVNAEAQRWGRNLSDEVRSGDVGSAKIVPRSIADPVELLTLRLERVSPTAATLVFEWERSRLEIPITVVGEPGSGG